MSRERARTVALLRAAFSAALVAACRDKPETMPPPPPTAPTAPTGGPTTTATPTATAASSVTRTTLPPTQKRFGQRCAGALVAALDPARHVDYLELRLDFYSGMPEVHEVVTTGATGTPCATAKDKAKCQMALDAAIPPKSTGGEYLVYTRGDDVGTVRGKEIPAFLAPITSPEEAAMALVYPLTEGTSSAAVLPDCDPAKFTKTNAGYDTVFVTTSFCDERHETDYALATDGTAKVTKQVDTPPKPGCQRPFLGRRPEGALLSSEGGGAPQTAGEFFAECTEMEAASVCSFDRLERELAAFGAPRVLRDRARRSAADERRHARVMRRLARRFGARARRPVVASFGDRPAIDVAIENATHGCVFETWAALVASFQAVHATDPEVRAALAEIARDETRHAALAHDVAAWLEPRLSTEEQARARAARADAVRALARQIEAAPSPELSTTCGLPTAAEAMKLLHAFSGFFADAAPFSPSH